MYEMIIENNNYLAVKVNIISTNTGGYNIRTGDDIWEKYKETISKLW